MKRPRILILERSEALCQNWRGLLLHHGWEIIASSDKASVLHFLPHRSLDLIIVGSARGEAWDGLEIARQIRRWNRTIPLIMVAEDSSEELVIAALKAGVNDYFKQPFSGTELAASVHRYLVDFFSPTPLASQETAAADLIDGQRMIGESETIQEIKAYIKQVALTESNVLITGETGTGKELVAELIHKNSPRHQKPLVCINCAAIPESLLESELFGYERGAFTGADASKEGSLKLAEGGTIFFDEIGDMNPSAQAKILRTIESREIQRLGAKKSIPVDIRVIAATNQDLERLISAEKFRKDLYFRLNVARIHLPPLRDRKKDILLLLDYYIREWNRRFGREVEGFTPEVLECLLTYEWPGNTRELKNLIEATFVNLPSRRIAFMDLPEVFRRQFKEATPPPQNERDRVLSALLSTQWNMSRAAQQLHWSRMTLYRKMAKYHIVRENKTENSTVTNPERTL